MKELVVISGKGGTGKTSIVASFAALAKKCVLADCDVAAPDLALVLEPTVERSAPFIGGKTARINSELCTACGRCATLCRFEAVLEAGAGDGTDRQTYAIDPLACEGCGVCAAFCPAEAIELVPAVNGEWYVSRMRHGPMVHARLGIARENSGKLVSLVRKQARALAEQASLDLLVGDGPPGIGCPVIASLGGADLALVVVEPSVSGIHDFQRVVALASHFKVPAIMCINKFDLNEEMSAAMAEDAWGRGVEVAGRIPYDETVVAAQIARTSVVEYSQNRAGTAIQDIWKRVEMRLNQG